jgi:hypothetical protein
MSRSIWLRWIVVSVLSCGLAGCAAGPASVAPATPTPVAAASPTTVSLPAPGQPTGKLTPRLQLLADSPALRSAGAEEQARALSLPAQGPGSLVRDAQSRILVSIRTSDVSDGFQKALRDNGADVTDVSEPYKSVTAFVPAVQLTAIAGLPAVLNVQEELAPGTSR